MAYKKKHAVIMEKKSDTAVRECKAVRFNVESVDEESGEFSGHAAVFDNVDDGGDIIEPGAFSRTISDTQKGRDVQTLLKDGVLNELSIGYDAITFDFDSDKGVRHLKEVRLWEISIVTWAMNDQATIDEVKSLAESLKIEAKAGKITRTRLDALKPFIAVVRELADILGPFLDPPVVEDEPGTQNNVTKATKNPAREIKKSGMIFEIIP